MEKPEQGLTENLGDQILRAAVVDLVGRAVVAVLSALLLVFGLLIWSGGDIPAWVVLLALIVVLAGVVGLLRRQGRVLAELARHSEYSRHLQNSLDALQRVISGDVDAEIPYFLEQAVLEPALRILTEKPAEKVRLSVLLPADDDPSRWSMRWSAGHSMQGKLKFSEPIAGTLARHAFEKGEAQYWPDTEEQTEFQQNPLASNPTRSLVSLPIQEGDEVLGVFNVISSEKEAFDEVERTFLASLAGVIAVAVSVWHRDGAIPDSDRNTD